MLVIAVTRENRKWERERVFKDLLSFILCVYVSACMHARVPHVCLVPVKAKQGMSDLLELDYTLSSGHAGATILWMSALHEM